jgi:hypothetical protein
MNEIGVTYAPGTETVGGPTSGTSRLSPQEAIRILNLRLPKRPADGRWIAPAALLSGAGSGAPSVAAAGGLQAILRALARSFGAPVQAGNDGGLVAALAGPGQPSGAPTGLAQAMRSATTTGAAPRLFAAPPPHIIAGGGGLTRYPDANRDEFGPVAPLIGSPTPGRVAVESREMPVDADAEPLELPELLRWRGGGGWGDTMPHLDTQLP